MTLQNNQSISVTLLINLLLNNPNEWGIVSVGTINGKELNKHKIKINTDAQQIEYHYFLNNGNEQISAWTYVSDISNLPNKGKRYYLFSHGKRISKLHFYAFSNGIILFSRHDYNHIYRSQSYSTQSKGLKNHDYNRNIKRLLKKKQKLTLYYNGERTKTAKRLDYYTSMESYYSNLSLKHLMRRYGFK